MAREINLVPDIKNEMIKTLKLRNYIFFGCIVVAIASIAAIVITGVIAGGQQIAINNRKDTIAKLSEKLNSYSDLNDFLTIKNQLDGISNITSNKQVLSRTFDVLSAIIPTGPDSITVSELNVDLTQDQPILNMEAQANAGQEPYIDYNVLESFKKSMDYMRYDWGNYVDKEGNTIPAYCMIESGSDGATFKEVRDGKDNYYAYWIIEGEGCNPSEKTKSSDYSTEDYEGQKVVRIWRTPQFNDWYKTEEKSNQPYMGLDGEIKNVAHFESQCYQYSGDDSGSRANPKWDETNDCHLIEDQTGEAENGITIDESSNGRDMANELVLRFTATIKVAPEAYEFNKTHLLALAPSDHRNVTDSYVQVQSMFGQRASDCAEGDTACKTNQTNSGGNNG